MNIILDTVARIRACRSDRNIPCLVRCGFTIAIRDTPYAIRAVDGGNNFSGYWNSCVQWDRAGAEAALAKLVAAGVDFRMEVIHVNKLRDRSEETWTRSVRSCWPKRRMLRAA